MNTVPPHRRDVAMVFQSYALYPHKTVYENIAFGLRMRKHAEGRDRPRGCGTPRAGWKSSTLLERRPTSFPAGSASASRWGARWCASPPCS